MDRRSFVRELVLGATALLQQQQKGHTQVTTAVAGAGKSSEMNADVVIVGGGTGGCAAAMGALRNHLRVIMTEETDWIGGQLTAQAVPPDESRNPWIEA